ncbi:hypothetical protein GGQ80_001210 [Sphingomonas jinjuensis]|uniref:Uncharacterized protein n=1 Tax=Sphingomonas jinjuensis TaxID=535907 RepID=A0A840FH50_9SPHN|nr:hypothetical protein [Sphingomonas jinjuensis]MBB4153308.1 hypothetical protein [Sphingomonas jinjuensis]
MMFAAALAFAAPMAVPLQQPPAASDISDASIAAVAMPEAQLRAFLARTLFTTQSVPQSFYALGMQKGCAALRPAFESAVSQTLPQWRANIVAAYRSAVPAPVLRSAIGQTAEQRQTTLAPYLGAIGTSMQSASEPLLRAAAERVTAAMTTAAAGIDMATIDGATRMAELRQAQADGSLTCGVVTTGQH